MSLATTITLTIDALLAKVLDLSPAQAHVRQTITKALATGTGADQADKIWHDRRTIAASATDSLDLAGALLDGLGDAFTPARIKAVIVVAALANTNNVNVTRPASNGLPLFLAAGDGIAVRPGGVFVWIARDATGVAVTGGTGDLLDIVNSAGGTDVTYDIYVIGASA